MNNQSKSSFFSAIAIEAAVVGILVILVVITLQFFNVINIPLLSFVNNKPKEVAKPTVNKIVKIRKSGQECEMFKPKRKIYTILPQASVSAKLKPFSGVWEGKWNGQVKSVLIVNTIDNKKATASYYFRSPPTTRLTLLVQPDGKTLKDEKGETSWEIDNGGFLVGTQIRGPQRSMVSMVKCTPSITNNNNDTE